MPVGRVAHSMTFLVPFDGSARSQAALVRARIYSVALEHAPASIRREVFREYPLGVLAMAVIPESTRYAREKDWIGDDESFDAGVVVSRLHKLVSELDPEADFTHERVDGEAMEGTISRRLRSRAKQDDVTVVFIGSQNAGRIITPITSVAGGVAASQDYDVHIVRSRLPSEAREQLRSEFFLVD